MTLTHPRTPRVPTASWRLLLPVAVLLCVFGHAAADCPADGDGGDPALNRLKNRTDQPRTTLPMSVPQIIELKLAHTRLARSRWSAAQQQVIADLEGRGVVVVGWLVGVKEEGPEASNCHGDGHDQHDFHMYLANEPGAPKAETVVIEITPRQHDARWTLAAMRRLVRERTMVRVTGWLMYDQEHEADIGRSRGTVWEIHPVTGIEVQMGNGGWTRIGSP